MLRLQLESEINLKDLKLDLLKVQSAIQLEEANDKIANLQILIGKVSSSLSHLDQLSREKKEIASHKEDQLTALQRELKGLEAQLIQAKLDMATMRGQLEAERNQCLILKKQLKDSSKVPSGSKVVKGPSTFEFLKSLRQQREESEGEEEKRAGSSSQGRNNS